MPYLQDHDRHVAQWMNDRACGLSHAQVLALFETAMNALWRRADRTLGSITVAAVMHRVLYYTLEKYPLFASIRIESNGINCGKLRAHAAGGHERELMAGIQFMLAEFLEIVGHLTAEVLSPSLRSELSSVSLKNTAQDDHEPERIVS